MTALKVLCELRLERADIRNRLEAAEIMRHNRRKVCATVRLLQSDLQSPVLIPDLPVTGSDLSILRLLMTVWRHCLHVLIPTARMGARNDTARSGATTAG